MWMQCITPYPGDFEGIQDKFEMVFMVLGGPKDMALFCRTTDDRKHEICLLSPAAAYMSANLKGEWCEALDVHDHEWTVLVANGNARDQFGLRIGTE